MKRIAWCMIACILLCRLAFAEYSPGYLMQPPAEVLEHIARSFSSYTLEDYCEIDDTPGGDYGFALLTAGDERMLVGYEEKNGKMSYWLKNHGAVPQGSEEAWFSVSEKGREYVDSRTDRMEVSDGLSFSVIRLDDAGESYEKAVSYRWKDGGFRLSSYKHDTSIGVYIEDGYLEFWDWGWWRKDGAVEGRVQTDIRYVSYPALPETIGEAREKLSSAPHIPQGGLLQAFEVKFTGGRKYPVYSGPGEQYARSGNGKGQVSTNDWIQVFGRVDGYVMIQYAISADRYRIGWMEAKALPQGAKVPWMTFGMGEQTLIQDCILTDDPLRSCTPLDHLSAGTQVVNLCNLGYDWVYVQSALNGELCCGFVPAAALGE